MTDALAEPPVSEQAVMLPRPLRWIDDRLNPVFVKEVRQALRGRLFRIGFVIVLVIAILVSASMLIDAGVGQFRPNGGEPVVSAHEGRDFFIGVFVCLNLAVLGLVPFAAFLSMAAEWDENTADLLVISNLRPRQILLGKLLSAVTQSALFFSVFTPFLSLAFLLRGVDLFAGGLLLFASAFFSTGLAMVGIALSTLSRNKFSRVLLMAALAGMSVACIAAGAAMADELLRSPGDLRTREGKLAVAAIATFFSALFAFGFAAGCNMLAHPEENRSTGVRALTSAMLLAALVFGSVILSYAPDRDGVSAMSIMFLLGLFPSVLFFVSERESLGRRVGRNVPKNAALALLATPWLPGGGRGVLFLLLHVAAVLAFSVAGHRLMIGPSETLLEEGFLAPWIVAPYLVLFLVLGSFLACRRTERLRPRLFVRIGIVIAVAAAAFLPAVAGFFLRDRDLMEMEHFGHPFWLVYRNWEGPEYGLPALIVIGALALVAILLNARRLARSVSEVAVASSALRRQSLEESRAEAAS